METKAKQYENGIFDVISISRSDNFIQHRCFRQLKTMHPIMLHLLPTIFDSFIASRYNIQDQHNVADIHYLTLRCYIHKPHGYGTISQEPDQKILHMTVFAESLFLSK